MTSPDLPFTLVNLSHVNDPATTVVYPGDPAFTSETVATIERDGFYLRFLRQGEHTGTHWGAPGHFHAGEALADDLEPVDLCRPAVRVDVRRQCAADPDYTVTVGDIHDHEQRYGRIPPESFVVIWTGWDARWGSPAYANLDAGGVPHQPGFALETVEWLAETGRIGHRGGTGTDTFGPDPGHDTTYAVSKVVYRRHRVSLEVLANLAALPPAGAHLLCGGTVNRAGSGSPGIIWALLPR